MVLGFLIPPLIVKTGTVNEIFYSNLKQKEIAEKVFLKFNGKFYGKIVTKISEIKNYCKAEDYHQKYLEKKY